MKRSNFRTRFAKSFALLAAIAAVLIAPMAIPVNAYAEEETAVAAPAPVQESNTMRFWAATAAVGLGSLAGGMAVAIVGSAALGAVSERPELMGRSLIFLGLAEGICLYGTIIAFMILFK
ncbi:ATPase [bacterium]|nr:ATPase [bacterium]